MAEKELLILGYGYLGECVARRALSDGWKVRAVSRNETRLANLETLGGEGFIGLVNESQWHDFADTNTTTHVLNCVSSAGNGLEGYRLSYVEGNRSLARWMESSGFKGKAIYTSSVSVYPDAEGGWLDEDCGLEPNTERGRLIRKSEELFLRADLKCQRAVLRLGGIYGPGRHWLANRLKEAPRELPGEGNYYLNLIRTEDIVEAVFTCFGSEETLDSCYNVVDDTPSLKADIVEWLAGELGVEVPVFSGSKGSRSHRNLDGRGSSNRRLKNKKLRDAVQWKPSYKSFREGFRDLINDA
ncbi:MAG: NAD-dependent epimerase/dehydratase family protein [Verrucomicrobiota bacterium]